MGKKATQLTYISAFASSGLIFVTLVFPIFFDWFVWFRKPYIFYLKNFQLDVSFLTATVTTSSNFKIFLPFVQGKGLVRAFFRELFETNRSTLSLNKFIRYSCAFDNITLNNALDICYNSKMLGYAGMIMILSSVSCILLQIVGCFYTYYFWQGGKKKGRYRLQYIESSRKFFLTAFFAYLIPLIIYTTLVTMFSMSGSGGFIFNNGGFPDLWVGWFCAIFACVLAYIPYTVASNNHGSSEYDEDTSDTSQTDSEALPLSFKPHLHQAGQLNSYSVFNQAPYPPPAGNIPQPSVIPNSLPPPMAVNTRGVPVSLPVPSTM